MGSKQLVAEQYMVFWIWLVVIEEQVNYAGSSLRLLFLATLLSIAEREDSGMWTPIHDCLPFHSK